MFWLLCRRVAPPSWRHTCLNALGKHANYFVRKVDWDVIGTKVSAVLSKLTIGEHTPAQCAAPAQIRLAIWTAETWQRWEILLAEACRIKHITQAEPSIVPIKIWVQQRLDLWVADICSSHPPIAAATPALVWWSPLLQITHPPVPKGVVVMSCIRGESLSSPKSALSIVILPVVATPSLPLSSCG